MTRGVEARIDAAALRANARRARACAPDSQLMCVAKADGYGHGLATVVQALRNEADAFAVTTLEEASEVRRAGATQRLVLLEGFFAADEIPWLASLGVEPVVHQPWQVEALEAVPSAGLPAAWVKVDSGMHRLGFPPDAVAEAHRRVRASGAVTGEVGLASHLAEADDRHIGVTRDQVRTFEAACAGLEGPRSLANSAGVLGWPETHMDWIRPGIMLYGTSPFIGGRGADEGLAPVMTLHGRLIATNTLEAGEPIGYGGTWRCPERMRVGVVSIGYGDGYPRHAPSGTPVLIDGRRSQLVGRVSMDMITVDLRHLDGVQPGAPAVLWGQGLPAEEIAEWSGTISYELFCRTTPRVPRLPQIGA